jgi:hypothetical protein
MVGAILICFSGLSAAAAPDDGYEAEAARAKQDLQRERKELWKHQRPVNGRARGSAPGGFSYTCVDWRGGRRVEVPCVDDVPSEVRASYRFGKNANGTKRGSSRR